MKQKMSDKAKFIIITASNSTEMSNNQEHSTRGVVLYAEIILKYPRFGNWIFHVFLGQNLY